MNRRVLLVDDEADVLSGYRRLLRRDFDIQTALGGEIGLNTIAKEEPFAVIVSDMRMPGMNGAEFLEAVQKQSPDSVRMLLTGQADLEDTKDAINRGRIFRYLDKPCPRETFVHALEAGVEMYRLTIAERELLENTLTGSIEILTQLLEMVSPKAFGRASRVQQYVTHMADRLELPDPWKYRILGTLSQIGCLTLPSETLDKIYAKQALSEQEQNLFDTRHSVAAKLLENIPRLEPVVQMIKGRDDVGPAAEQGEDAADADGIAVGSRILAVAETFDQLVSGGETYKSAMSILRARGEDHGAKVLDALSDIASDQPMHMLVTVTAAELRPHMVPEQDIVANNGALLVASGQPLTPSVLHIIHTFAGGVGIAEPIRVTVER